jgi:hypothetical protein
MYIHEIYSFFKGAGRRTRSGACQYREEFLRRKAHRRQLFRQIHFSAVSGALFMHSAAVDAATTPRASKQWPSDDHNGGDFSTPVAPLQTGRLQSTHQLTWDWTQVHRMLRPLRAKLLSLSRQVQLPSSCTGINENSSSSRRQSLGGKSQPVTTVKAVYQRRSTLSGSSRSSTNLSTNFAPLPAVRDSKLPDTIQTTAMTSVYHVAPRSQQALAQNYQANRQIPSPIRRDTMYLRTIVAEALRKIGSSGGRQFRRTQIYTLAELAAFSVGSQVEYYEDLNEQEAIYEIIPDHHRRYTLLQHITELCVAYPSDFHVFREIISACLASHAHYQTFYLLCHALQLPKLNCDSVMWIYSVAKSIRKAGPLLDFFTWAVLDSKTAAFPFLLPFSQAVTDFDRIYRISLRVLELLLQKDEDYDQECREDRIKAWVSMLVSRLFLVNCILPSTIVEDIHRLLYDYDWQRHLLAKTCLNIALIFICQSLMDDEERLDVDSTQPGQISYLVFSFGSLDRIVQVVKTLHSVQQTDLAAKIMFLIVKEYDSLNSSSHSSSALLPSLKECQDLLSTLESQLMDSTVKK